MPQHKSAERFESRRLRLESTIDQPDHGHADQEEDQRGGNQLKGIEYGVKGARYDEASVNPTPIDIAGTPQCFLAVNGIGGIPRGEPPTAGMVFFGPAAAWSMAENYPEYPQLQQPVTGLKTEAAEGAFEIIDDSEIVYASNLEISEEGNIYNVTSVLNMKGDLKDRDKDGYADSFRLDEVTGRVLVSMGTGSTSTQLIKSEYSFGLKNKLDILNGYGDNSPYTRSSKSGAGAMRLLVAQKSLGIAVADPIPTSSGLATINPFIQSHLTELTALFAEWQRCVVPAINRGGSVTAVALDCALLVL